MVMDYGALAAQRAATEAKLEELEKKLAEQRTRVWKEQVILNEMTNEWKDVVLKLGRLRRGFRDGDDSSSAPSSD